MKKYLNNIRNIITKYFVEYFLIEGIFVIFWILQILEFEVFVIMTIISSIFWICALITNLMEELILSILSMNEMYNIILIELLIRKERGEMDVSPNSNFRIKEIINLSRKISNEIKESLK